MSDLTIIMAAYGQPEMLDKWWETLRCYDDGVLDRLHLIVVDDHGDPPVDIPFDIQAMLDCRLFRVMAQIPWNQMGCRNLAMQHCTTDWALMLDPDMVVEPAMIKKIFSWMETLKRGRVVKLLIRYTNDVLDASSPNIYIIHREDFKLVGGYDEDYAGHKGWSDVQLLHTLSGFKLKFSRPAAGDLWVRYYRPHDISDATVRTLNRSVAHNRRLHLGKMDMLRKGGWKTWAEANRKKQVRFQWERLI